MQFTDAVKIRVLIHQVIEATDQFSNNGLAASKVVGCQWMPGFVDLHGAIVADAA